MASRLLHTKLYRPAVRPRLVDRPRLIRKLDDGLRVGRGLTLICAPAGYGKSTLAAQWLAEVDRPVAGLGRSSLPLGGRAAKWGAM